MYSRAVAGVFRQLREKWRDPAIRRAAGSLMLGKMIGLGIVLLLISKWYLPSAAYADAAPRMVIYVHANDQHSRPAMRSPIY